MSKFKKGDWVKISNKAFDIYRFTKPGSIGRIVQRGVDPEEYVVFFHTFTCTDEPGIKEFYIQTRYLIPITEFEALVEIAKYKL